MGSNTGIDSAGQTVMRNTLENKPGNLVNSLRGTSKSAFSIFEHQSNTGHRDTGTTLQELSKNPSTLGLTNNSRDTVSWYKL